MGKLYNAVALVDDETNHITLAVYGEEISKSKNEVVITPETVDQITALICDEKLDLDSAMDRAGLKPAQRLAFVRAMYLILDLLALSEDDKDKVLNRRVQGNTTNIQVNIQPITGESLVKKINPNFEDGV